MRACRLMFAIVAGCALAGYPVKAEEPAAAGRGGGSGESAEAAAPTVASPRGGQLSGRIAAAVRAKLPEFDPAAAARVADGPPPPDVVVMPEMVVREPKIRAPDVREWLTKRGLADELWKRHPGASLRKMDAVERPMPNYSALMDAEERRLGRLRDLNGLADTIGAAIGEDRVGSLRREIERASMRRPDSLTDAMDRAANNGRR